MKFLETVFQKEIAIIIGALVLSVGAYTVSTATATHQDSKPLTYVQLRANEISAMMQTISISSSAQDLSEAQGQLRIQYYWADRQIQTSEINKFDNYIEACNQVIISYSHGQQPDLTAMNQASTALN